MPLNRKETGLQIQIEFQPALSSSLVEQKLFERVGLVSALSARRVRGKNADSEVPKSCLPDKQPDQKPSNGQFFRPPDERLISHPLRMVSIQPAFRLCSYRIPTFLSHLEISSQPKNFLFSVCRPETECVRQRRRTSRSEKRLPEQRSHHAI